MNNLTNKDNAIYEVIENELINDTIIKGLDISGSLFSLTTFKNTTFESCVFFGSRIENSHFLNCTFINCTFQFSNIENTVFKATSFKNCIWELSPIKNSELSYCFLDTKTAYQAHKDHNEVIACSSEETLTWAEVMNENRQLQEETEENKQGSLAQSFIDATYTIFQDFKKTA